LIWRRRRCDLGLRGLFRRWCSCGWGFGVGVAGRWLGAGYWIAWDCLALPTISLFSIYPILSHSPSSTTSPSPPSSPNHAYSPNVTSTTASVPTPPPSTTYSK
jgi:hypothetical protein